MTDLQKDLEKKDFVYKFLETLCHVDCAKHKLKINKLFYETLHISIVEEQAKKVFNLLRKDKDFKIDINKLYK